MSCVDTSFHDRGCEEGVIPTLMGQASNQALSDVNSVGAGLAEVKSKLEELQKELAPEAPPPPPPEKVKAEEKKEKARETLDSLIQQVAAIEEQFKGASENIKRAQAEAGDAGQKQHAAQQPATVAKK